MKNKFVLVSLLLNLLLIVVLLFKFSSNGENKQLAVNDNDKNLVQSSNNEVIKRTDGNKGVPNVTGTGNINTGTGVGKMKDILYTGTGTKNVEPTVPGTKGKDINPDTSTGNVTKNQKSLFEESKLSANIDNYAKQAGKIKPTAIDNGKKWDTESSFKAILYNILLENKAIANKDKQVCDVATPLENENNSNMCVGKFYLSKLIKEKDKAICNNFGDNNTYGKLLDSSKPNKEVCNKFYTLLTKTNASSGDIKSFVDDISPKNKVNLTAILDVIVLKKDSCKNIETLNGKLTCYQFLYMDNFTAKFDTSIMPELLNSKYLRGNPDQ